MSSGVHVAPGRRDAWDAPRKMADASQVSRRAEQAASVFGEGGSRPAGGREIRETPPPRFTGVADTPNERLVSVLQEALDISASQVRVDACMCAGSRGRCVRPCPVIDPYPRTTASLRTRRRRRRRRRPSVPRPTRPTGPLSTRAGGPNSNSRASGRAMWSRRRRSRCSRTCSARGACSRCAPAKPRVPLSRRAAVERTVCTSII